MAGEGEMPSEQGVLDCGCCYDARTGEITQWCNKCAAEYAYGTGTFSAELLEMILDRFDRDRFAKGDIGGARE